MNRGSHDNYSDLPPAPIDNLFFHNTLGLKLSWTGNATYKSNIPSAHKDISSYKFLCFRAAKAPPLDATETDPIILYVNLEDNSGNKALWNLNTDQFDHIPHPYRKRIPDLNNLIRPVDIGGDPVDMISLTTVRIPLKNFTMNNSGVNLTDIKRVIIKFSGSGEIGIDDLEFTN